MRDAKLPLTAPCTAKTVATAQRARVTTEVTDGPYVPPSAETTLRRHRPHPCPASRTPRAAAPGSRAA
ncbi:hypothetical protein Cco03nite_81010 [Catellatospora coxensis]|uniref:Uncharacterized protein n=1 Tax=Catellatospora coxensis TaxID=310354 RepID=A0A8J3PBJ2_9ACTN|nr:hypothetical protein Cco03nite_81010 [Catellatospora coxensis]